MKQKQYSELQIAVMDVLERLKRFLDKSTYGKTEMEQIKKKYHIEDPYLTVRQYISKYSCGAYHTFHFTIDGEQIYVDDLIDMLTDEYCHLFAKTSKYYVINDKRKDNGGDVETYHCDHYLTLEPKED